MQNDICYNSAIKKELIAITVLLIIVLAIVGCSSSKEVNYTPPEGSDGPAINHFSFSKMVVDGKEFTDMDVAIFPDGNVGVWQIRQVHVVTAVDIEMMIGADTRVLIIGTGTSGVSEVTEEAIAFIKAKGVDVHVLETPEAVELFNSLKKVGMTAVFHTGC